MRDDTITAIATPSGEGAIGIVRLSGPEARSIGQSVFDRALRPRRVVYGRILEPVGRNPIDEGLATLMVGPHSYTGEDVVEISAHGGVRSLQRVLDATLAAGARSAQPGEFTLRAFLHGRMDLTQAESVLALIQARTDTTADIALAAMGGRLSAPIREARRQAIEVLAYLSARADFPDEDVPMRDIAPQLDHLVRTLDRLVDTASYGILQREGVRIAIVGRPNAGKSSLLNQLLGQERAIVTAVPGTTRDTVEESLDLLGLPVVLTDTAGIRATPDPIERLGVERTRAAAQRADLIVLVVDASGPLGAEDVKLLDEFGDPRLVAGLNKSDLGVVVMPESPELKGVRAVTVSAKTGDGMDRFREVLLAVATDGTRPPADGMALTTLRQRDAARRAVDHIRAARDGYRSGVQEDLLSADLGAAVRALGELTGENATEDLLDTIFSRFCIGK